MKPRVAEAACALLVALAGAVAWHYAGVVEGPHAVVRVAAVLGWLALFTLATVGLGVPLVRAASGAWPGELEHWLVAAASGAAALAGLAFLLSTLGLLRPAALLALLTAAAGAGIAVFAIHRPHLQRALLPVLPATILAFVSGLTLLAVATPSPFYDQLHYHLAFPERWLRSGTIEVFPRHSYSYLAANMGLLYSFGLAGPGAWGAQALHWWTGLVAACGAYCLTTKLGAGPRGAWWAAAFVVATPSFLLSSTWAASDLAVAAFGVVACTMVLGRDASRGVGWYALAGVLCGAAFGAKYVAATAVILPVGLLVAASMSPGRIAAWGAGIGVATLPWLARNAILTGNPIYPFLSRVFGESTDLESMTRAAAGIAGERGEAIDWLATLTLRTFDPIGAAGWIGPYWLVLLPLWLWLAILARHNHRPLLLAIGAALAIAAWTQFHQLGRYLLPVLVISAAGAGWTWEKILDGSSAMLRRAALTLMTLLLLWGIQGGASEELFTRIACTFGRSSPQALFERYVSYWPALARIQGLPETAKLLLVGESRAFGIPRDVVLEDPFRTPYLLEAAERSTSAAAMAQALRADGITHVLFNEQEAARIAAMRGQATYFAAGEPATTAKLQQFLDGCLELIDQAPPVRLYRLRDGC